MQMNLTKNRARGLGLCSGGLDSILSGLLLVRQGIEVEWISFETPFFTAGKARKASRITGIPLRIQNITTFYMDMLKEPNCGYGKNMNPCLDCHALMFKLATQIMHTEGFDFLFSGEVLGQRPMSQTRSSLRYVEKNSGSQGYILRPLSALKLPETIPEKSGLIDRSQLLGLAGRSRKPQIKLAQEFGVKEYPAPAGGCLLTDKGYSLRLKDLFQHQAEIADYELELLKYGRHFRINEQAKVIVGRTKADNEKILKHRGPDHNTVLKVRNVPGPTAVILAADPAPVITLAATICASYSKAPKDTSVEVQVESRGQKHSVRVIGLDSATFKHLLV
jgi:tRNA U34 2-thiouridine synthase MnmA/TrmU